MHHGRFLVLAIALLPLIFAGSLRAASTDPAKSIPIGQSLDDPLEGLKSQELRSEEDEDRIESVGHFAAARMLEGRQHFGQALRQYERALRYGPSAGAVLKEMMPLAFSTTRSEEGLRYLAKYIDQSSLEPQLVQKAGQFLAETGNWQEAIKVLSHAAAQLEKEPNGAQQATVQMELARLCLVTQQYAASATAFRRVLDALDAPTNHGFDAAARKELLGDARKTYELMGSVFLEAQQPDAARRAFEALDKVHHDSAALAIHLARVDLAERKPQASLEKIEHSLDEKTEGRTVEVYQLLVKALSQSHQDEQIIPRLESLHAKQPSSAAIAFVLGKQYAAAGNFAKAQELLESSHAAKGTEQTYQALVDVYRQTDQPGKLLKLLGDLVEDNGSLAGVVEEGKPIDKDEKLTSELIEYATAHYSSANLDDYFPLRVAAALAANAKRWNDAEALFNLAIKARPKAAGELLLMWGLGLVMDEKYAQAAAVLQRGIDEKALADDKPAFHYYLASALEMQGKTEEALAAAKIAAEKDPHIPNYLARPAWILYHAKRYDDAAKAYEGLIEKLDDDYTTEGNREVVREARSALSNLCVLRHDPAPAAEWLQQILDEFPDDPGASNDLGYLWADQNEHLQRAHKMIQLAVAAEPDNFAYRDSLGWVLHRLGRESEAAVQLQRAVNPEKPDGEVLDHLGEVYLQLGQKGEAKSAWTRAAEAFRKAGEEAKMKAVQEKLEN